MREEVLASLQCVFERKTLIIGITGLAFLLSLLVALFVKPEYEAEVILAVNSFHATGELEELLPGVYSAKNYDELLLSTTVVGETHSRLQAAKAWADEGEPPSIREFILQLRVDINVVDQTTRPVRYSPFIRLRVVDESSERAQQIADTWASVARSTSGRVYSLQVDEAKRVLAKHADTHKNTLQALWDEQAREEAQWNVDVLITQLDDMVTRIEGFSTQLVELERERASAEEQLASLEESLAEEDEFLELFQAPSDDVYWLRRAEGASEEELADLRSRGMKTEVPNSVYISLKKDVSQVAKELAGKRASIQSLEQKVREQIQEQENLQGLLAEHKFTQIRLTLQSDLYKTAYKQIESGRLLMDTVAEMSLAKDKDSDRAIGLNKVYPKVYFKEYRPLVGRRTQVIMATFLAFAFSVGYVLAAHWFPPLLRSLNKIPETQEQ